MEHTDGFNTRYKKEKYIRYGDPGRVGVVFIVGNLVQLVDVLIPQIPNLWSPYSQLIISKDFYIIYYLLQMFDNYR